MGGFLSPKKLTVEEQKTFHFLKTSSQNYIQLTDLVECFVFYHKTYNGKDRLSFQQFDDIFSPILNDSSIIFSKISQDHHHPRKASFYQAIASLMLFCTGDFYDKAKYLAHMFDLNGDLIMQLDQFHHFIKSALNGICKIRDTPIKQGKEYDNRIDQLFAQLDKQQAKQIPFPVFQNFLRISDEVQEFLFNFTGKQTFEQAQKLSGQLYSKYLQVFKKQSFSFLDEDFCTVPTLKNELIKTLRQQSCLEQDIETLFKLLDCQEKGAISQEDFQALISHLYRKPWAVYTACDFKKTGEIQASQLKQMIWLVDGKEPPEYRVQKQRQLLNLQQSKTIPRNSWIKYLACIDPNAGFNFSMKKNFDYFDFDRDGVINMAQLTLLIKSTLSQISNGKSSSQKKMIDELVRSLATDIMRKLDPHNRGGLDWSSFKMYMHYASEKEKKLKDFISNYC